MLTLYLFNTIIMIYIFKYDQKETRITTFQDGASTPSITNQMHFIVTMIS
jgi:hypothetical protein